MKTSQLRQVVCAERYQRCPQCDTLFSLPDITNYQSANCPCCDAQILKRHRWSLSRLSALAAVMLLLMPFACTLPLLSIRLLGMPIHASLLDGIKLIVHQGDILTATMITFCVIGAPLTLACALLWLFYCRNSATNLRPVLLMLHRLKEWTMLDIYLVGIAVTATKVQDYATVTPGTGLAAYVLLTLFSLLLLIHLNMEQLWQYFYPQPAIQTTKHLRVCLNCHFTSIVDVQKMCPRCLTPLLWRRQHSLQKCWAALIAAVILLIPANLLPISIIYLNGTRQTNTIFTGILSLAQDNIPVAMIVFIASILVPFGKIAALLMLLLSIHFHQTRARWFRMKLLRLVMLTGRWSMLDLFVISLTLSLVNRGQLLAFTFGPAAFYFGSAVILTILAVEWLDSRLIWDAHGTGNANNTAPRTDKK